MAQPEAESGGVRTARWISVIFVLAIIGLLLFASARSGDKESSQNESLAERPNIATCAGRLGALGTALRMYAADNGSLFPRLPTPRHADELLVPMLDNPDITAEMVRCPARADQPYLYHCYQQLGEGRWPKWMDGQRTLSTDDPGETWLASDILLRGTDGPHMPGTKAYNYLCVDGSVHYSAAQPRTLYR